MWQILLNWFSRWLFHNKKIKKFSNIPESEGNVPFVSCTSKNNGIERHCGEKPIDGNCVTVSTNGRCFDSFYQPKPFAVSNDVEVLYSDKLNKFVALFVVTVLNLEHHKWTFGRKPKHGKVFKTKILLPADENSNPDYKKMETFMKKHYEFLNVEVKKNKELILKFIKPSLQGGV